MNLKNDVCLFGGTFNPVHNAHIVICSEVKSICGFKKIIFIPNNIPPHREKPIDAKHRYRMLEIALSKIEGFEISDIEIKRKGISYFYDTLLHFKGIYENISVLIGTDQANRFRSWHRWEEYFKIAKMMTIFKDEKLFEILPFELIKIPVMDISSTQIRDRVTRGLSIKGYVPQKVEDYIYENELYR